MLQGEKASLEASNQFLCILFATSGTPGRLESQHVPSACDSSHFKCYFHTVAHMFARSIWIIKKLLFLSELPERQILRDVQPDTKCPKVSSSLTCSLFSGHAHFRSQFLSVSVKKNKAGFLLKHNLIELIFFLFFPWTSTLRLQWLH